MKEDGETCFRQEVAQTWMSEDEETACQKLEADVLKSVKKAYVVNIWTAVGECCRSKV